MSTSKYRNSQSFTDRPIATIQSLTNGSGAYACDFGPLGYRQRFASVRQHAIPPCISGLLFWGSPTTVFRGVITLIVNALDRITRCWHISHIIVEMLEGTTPTVANRYATSAIAFVVICLLFVATFFHSLPDYVNRCAGHAVSSPPFGRRFSAKATTTAAVAKAKIVLTNVFLGSTVAVTKPIGSSPFPTLFSRRPYDEQPSESLSYEVHFDFLSV